MDLLTALDADDRGPFLKANPLLERLGSQL